MRRFTLTLLAATTLAAIGSAEERKYLSVGDPAPSLNVQKWLKGTPIRKFESGKVYLVEFWATWCGPCKENIPHLTEMAAKYRGKVEIAGISIWENTVRSKSDYLPRVEEFVKAQGDKMVYNVAVDRPTQPVGDAWMRAAGEGGIPTSFIVGKDGRIAWIGHPSRADIVLDKVLEGTFDVESARQLRATEVEIVRPISEALESKKFAEAIRLIDRAIAKDPKVEPRYAYDGLRAVCHTNPAAAQAKSEQILKEANGSIGAYRMIGSIFAAEPNLPPDAYLYGKGILDAAVAKNEMKPFFLAMRAALFSHTGKQREAIAEQKEAIKAAESDANVTQEFLNFLRENLARYERGDK